MYTRAYLKMILIIKPNLINNLKNKRKVLRNLEIIIIKEFST